MLKITRATLAVGFLLAFFHLAVAADADAPKLFFSDAVDGATSGWNGSETKGAAITIWGLEWGPRASSSKLTVCGQDLDSTDSAAIPEWGAFIDEGGDPAMKFMSARGLLRTTFYLKSDMTAGDSTIQVTTSEGVSSTIPFHCRADTATTEIYFIDPVNGNDANNGLASVDQGGGVGPVQSFYMVRDLVSAGDAIYLRGGIYPAVSDPLPDDHRFTECMLELYAYAGTEGYENGSVNKSILVTAYPDEMPQLGQLSTDEVACGLYARSFSVDGPAYPWEYWTISKIKWRVWDNPWLLFNQHTAPTCPAQGCRNSIARHIRLIGNDFTNSKVGGSMLFMLSGGMAEYFYFYGNRAHDVSRDTRDGPVIGNGTRGYAFYNNGYGDGNYHYFAWNEISHNPHGRIQFYGHKAYDKIDNLFIHSNWFHHNGLFAITLGGRDGLDGGGDYVDNAYFFNNVIYSYSTDVDPSGNYTGSIRIGGRQEGGNYYIWNNTIYTSIQIGTGAIEVFQRHDVVDWKNNVIVQAEPILNDDEDIFTLWQGASSVDFAPSSHNLYRNDLGDSTTDGTAWDTTNRLNGDPKFAGGFSVANDGNSSNFALTSESTLAINTGVDLTSSGIFTTDFLGVTRGSAWDRGAFEFSGGGDVIPVDEVPAPPQEVQVD